MTYKRKPDQSGVDFLAGFDSYYAAVTKKGFTFMAMLNRADRCGSMRKFLTAVICRLPSL